EKDAAGHQENEARIQRVAAREQLATWCLRRVHRAHPAEKHRRVKKRVYPAEPLEIRITRHAGAEGDEHDGAGEGGVPRQPYVIEACRQEWRAAMFVHPSLGAPELTPGARAPHRDFALV